MFTSKLRPFCKRGFLCSQFIVRERIVHKREMRVVPIPANEDNYQYLIADEKTNDAAIVDPVNIKSIFSNLDEAKFLLTTALVTHHHWDHAAGTKELSEIAKRENRPVKIYAGDGQRVEAVDHVLKDGDELTIGSINVKAITTPCHTSTHVCYFVEDGASGERAVFTGDTLFIGGCGRFFEGTAEQMNDALNVRLAKLPGDTAVYCGHEYTVANLNFARTVEPDNPAIQQKWEWAQAERHAGQYTVPSTIAEEKTYNPFMRVNDSSLQKSLGVSDPIAAMQKLRDMKNNFRG